MGNDPPGQFTRVLHPRVGRHGDPPANVIPIGRSVIVPANGSLPNVILSPRAIVRIKRVLEREEFDVLHLHEPMTPVTCIAVLAMATAPIVATHHASGDLGWMKLGMPGWGFLASRIDERIAVSERARDSAARWFPGEYEVVPNGVLIPDAVEPGGREHTVTFAGRHEPRKGLHVLLRAWPEIHRRTGARLQVCGSDPLAVRLLLTRLRVPDDGIDVLGFLPQEELTALLSRTKALIAPSLGGESFGMVLTRAFACALPVVASDIPGYREVTTPETSRHRRAGGSGRSRRCGRGAARRRAPAGGDGRRGPRARDRAVLVAGHRSTSGADLRARARAGWAPRRMKERARRPRPQPLGARAARARRARGGDSRDLVARARVGGGGRRVRRGHVALGDRRGAAQPALHARPLALLAADDQPGAAGAAPDASARSSPPTGSACSETPSSRRAPESSPASPSSAATSRTARGRARRCSAPSSPTGCSTSSRSRSSSRGCCSRRRSRTGP